MNRITRLFALLLLSSAALHPAGAACKLARAASLDILVEGDRILVPGALNGHEVYFELDTGDGVGTMLFPAPAAAIGIVAGGAAGYARGATGGEAAIQIATVEKLTLGQWEGQGIKLPAMGTVPADSKVVGLLGEDILRHFDIEIDLKNHKLALYKPDGCEDANLAFWSDSYNSVDFNHFDPAYPSITFDGKVNGTTVKMLLDTGATHSMMALDLARTLGVGPDSPGTDSIGPVEGLYGQPQQAWVGKFTSFILDAEEIKPVKLGFYRFARTEAETGSLLGHRALPFDMILGMDFIKAHHLLISHSQKKLYFTYAGGKPFY